MKALSILQPYAWLIVTGRKDIENRTWYTGYRGPVLIHAGKAYPKGEYAMDADGYADYPPTREEMIGGIVGIATITGCVNKSDSYWFNGPWGFTLTDARAFPKLIPMRGALGFFDVPADVLAQIPAELLPLAERSTGA
jgi:hypothetical protein